MTRSNTIKCLTELVVDAEAGIPSIRIEAVPDGVGGVLQLREGQWIKGRLDRNIRIDQPTHVQGAGQPHAHVYGRKGEELVIVNLDGSASHGTKGRLHPDDARALIARGYKIPPDRMIEWWSPNLITQTLLG